MTLDPTTVTLAAVGAFILVKLLLSRRASTADVAAKLAAGAVVLDVRSEGEFRSGAYAGAIHVPVQELEARLSKVPKGRPVVVYCASGARSAMAVRILKKAGYPDVVNAGGLRHMP